MYTRSSNTRKMSDNRFSSNNSLQQEDEIRGSEDSNLTSVNRFNLKIYE